MCVRKWLIWATWFTTLFLTACGEKSVQPTVEPALIRFAIPNYRQAVYEALVDEFEQENPGVQVKLVFTEDILQQDSGSGTVTVSSEDDLKVAAAADVFTPLDMRYAAEQGALLDLTPLIESDGRFQAADFYPDLLEQYQWNGRTWAIPYETTFTLIYFNKDLFDAAGLPYPAAGWTWDDFLAAAKTLTVRENNETTQWGFIDPQFRPLYFVQGSAGPLYAPDADPPATRLGETAVTNAVRWYTDLFRVHQVTQQLPYLDAEALISGGQVAMWSEFTSRGEQRRPIMNLGVAPFPVAAPGDHSTPVSLVRAYVISAGTANPDAAWRWLDFVSRQVGDWSGFGGLTALPARRSVTEASGIWDNVDEELEAALRYAFDHAYVPVYGKGFTTAIEAILSGEKTVETALADARIEAEAALDARQTEPAAATPAAIIMTEPEDETAVSDAITIEFQALPHQLPAFRALAGQFQADNPGIVVNVRAIDFAGEPASLNSLAAGADCFQWSPGFDDETVTAVLSLEPFFETDPTLNQADFFPVALEPFTYQGQLRGLPSEITISLIAFNKDLFDASGVPYPSFDWRMDDFLETAVSLTQGEGETKQYGFVPDVYEPNDLLDFVTQLAGSDLIDDSTTPARLRFTDPAVIAAVRWVTEMTTEYAVKPVFLTSTGSSDGLAEYREREWLIGNGRAAMWSESGHFAGGVAVVSGDAAQRPDNVDLVPLPAALDGSRPGGHQATTGYFVSAAAEAPQACWQWITYLTEQPNLGTGLPARRETAESAAYWQQVGSERAAAYLFTVENATRPSFFQSFAEYPWLSSGSVWLAAAYDQIIQENISVETALEQAQASADSFQACLTVSDGFYNRQQQQHCYEELP